MGRVDGDTGGRCARGPALAQPAEKRCTVAAAVFRLELLLVLSFWLGASAAATFGVRCVRDQYPGKMGDNETG
jgi:hypothetical protein